MEKNKIEEIKEAIKQEGSISMTLKKKYFDGMSFGQIRQWLEDNGLDRHMEIELNSTEILVIGKDEDNNYSGVVLQVRNCDNNSYGVFGGVQQEGETEEQCAIRELKEETGLDIDIDELQKYGIDIHTHKYSNGDQAKFHTTRFILEIDENTLGKMTTEAARDEASGFVNFDGKSDWDKILKHQQTFVQYGVLMVQNSQLKRKNGKLMDALIEARNFATESVGKASESKTPKQLDREDVMQK